jgi:hypothetical protein
MVMISVFRLVQMTSAGAAPRSMNEITIFTQNVVDGSQNRRVVGSSR